MYCTFHIRKENDQHAVSAIDDRTAPKVVVYAGVLISVELLPLTQMLFALLSGVGGGLRHRVFYFIFFCGVLEGELFSGLIFPPPFAHHSFVLLYVTLAPS